MALNLSNELELLAGLQEHIGHDIHIVPYGSRGTPASVAIECYSCHEVLLSAERFPEEAEDPNEMVEGTIPMVDSESLYVSFDPITKDYMVVIKDLTKVHVGSDKRPDWVERSIVCSDCKGRTVVTTKKGKFTCRCGITVTYEVD